MEQMIPVTIDGVQVEVPAGLVLEAAHKAKVKIPTRFFKDINETANCRICVVDCGGRTAGCLRAARGPQHGCEDQHARRPGRAG